MFLLGTQGSRIAVGLNKVETEKLMVPVIARRCLVMGTVIWKLYRFHTMT